MKCFALWIKFEVLFIKIKPYSKMKQIKLLGILLTLAMGVYAFASYNASNHVIATHKVMASNNCNNNNNSNRCNACHGTGHCSSCRNGEQECVLCWGHGGWWGQPCALCGGEGSTECNSCQGTGQCHQCGGSGHCGNGGNNCNNGGNNCGTPPPPPPSTGQGN